MSIAGLLKNEKIFIGFIFLISVFSFSLLTGELHLFDWDEINFAAMAKECILREKYLPLTIDYKLFYEKPPLYIWFQVISMKIFGINEFGARFPNAVAGGIISVLIYLFGKLLHGHLFAMIWLSAYIGSFLPQFYLRSGLIDNWFNLYIFGGILGWFYALKSFGLLNPSERIFFKGKGITSMIVGSICTGLATLTKGPVAILLIGLTAIIWIITKRNKTLFKYGLFYIAIWLIISSLIFCIPFIIDAINFGSCSAWSPKYISNDSAETEFLIDILKLFPCSFNEFIDYHFRLSGSEDAGHGGFPGYHVVILFFGCFPASIFSLRYLLPNKFPFLFPKLPEYQSFNSWANILFWVVLILFSLVQTKIIHYSSAAYLPLTFLAAVSIQDYIKSKIPVRDVRIGKILLFIIMGILVCILGIFGVLTLYLNELKPFIKDPFAASNLEANIDWGFTVWIPFLLLLIGYIYLIYLVLFFKKKNSEFDIHKYHLKSYLTVIISTGLTLSSVSYFIVPKIEGITQRANIEFFKGLKKRNGNDLFYTAALGYKSYAPYFYADFRIPTHPRYFRSDYLGWLLEGNIDRNAYFSVRINRISEYTTDHYKSKGLKELYQKNGFVFFERRKSK